VIRSQQFFFALLFILDPLILSSFALLYMLKQTAGITAYTLIIFNFISTQIKKNHPLVADDFFDNNK
jgi:hypothetical protein